MDSRDDKINYRPELANELKEALSFAINFYSINFKRAYYLLTSMIYKESDLELSKLLEEASNCFDGSIFGPENFYENYADILEKKYFIEIVSDARAAYVLYEVYKKAFDDLESKVKTDNLSKMENYMVKNFFKILRAPMNNPNIQIKEGYDKCYYDRDFNANFQRDLKLSVDYLKKECQSTIDIFSIPDK